MFGGTGVAKNALVDRERCQSFRVFFHTGPQNYFEFRTGARSKVLEGSDRRVESGKIG